MQIALSKNAVEFAFRQTSDIVCRFSLRCETAENHQSSIFDKICAWWFYLEAYFRQCRSHCLKTLSSLPFGKHRILYAVSHFVAKRRKIINPRFLIKSALDDFIWRLILAMQIALSKNAVEFAFRQTSDIVCRFSLRCETAENHQSSIFDKICAWWFYLEAYFRQCR